MVIKFLFSTVITLLLLMTSANAKYCTEKDDVLGRGVDTLDNLYEFGLKIQKAVKDKDLEAIKAMVKRPLINKKFRISYFENKKFDEVFTEKDRYYILKEKVDCASVGSQGFMLGNGKVWYDNIGGLTIISFNLGSK